MIQHLEARQERYGRSSFTVYEDATGGCFVYRDILCLLDEDKDMRIVDAVDVLLDEVRLPKGYIRAVKEHEGMLFVHPNFTSALPGGIHVGGDYWSIEGVGHETIRTF